MALDLKFIVITELALVLNFSGFVTKNCENFNDEITQVKAKELTNIRNRNFSVRPVFDWNKQYEKTLHYIKDHEGFAGGSAYICPGGYKTIGYGHIILENEHFTQITEQQADSILRADFNKALSVLDANIKLDGPKRLAMAHFVFAKGIGSFNRSTLKKKILKNEPIDEEITKWCYYTNRKGEKVKSQHALNIRKWELELYYFRS